MTDKQKLKAEKDAKVQADFAALPPAQRKAGYGVMAILVLGGGFLLISTLKGCAATPAAPNTASMTPAQLLAVGNGLPQDDPGMAAAFSRLDAVCPENGAQVADIATNFKALIEKDTGKTFPIIFLMNKLADAQTAAGASEDCVHTGAYLATVATNW